MAVQGEDFTSRGDIMRRLRKIERRQEMAAAERRLEAASIGAGGLRVKGGHIKILDDDGNEVMALATDGLTLDGLLKILAGGEFHFEDGDGVRRVRISGRAGGGEANVSYRSSTNSSGEVSFGALFDADTGNLVGHGLVVQQDTGTDVFKARSLDGTTLIDCQYSNGGLALRISDEVVLSFPDGTTAQRISDDRWAIAYPDVGGSGTAVEVDDELAVSGPGTRGVVIRITEDDGIRFAVDTDSDGVQSGQVTAGAADSAGAGFRTLRIPN